ncbi:MAG: MMPL family transporter [Clostridiales bacterium]|nr:MMPL family transporter [Clostridiales bacterium]
MQEEIDDAVAQMKGENYSLLMFSTTFPEESEDTTAFLRALTEYGEENLSGDFYLIGNSPMVYEMQNSFHSELLRITLLTAIAIFLVVMLTFRSLIVPAILVLVVQCGVYLTMATCGLIGYSIYYLALLIV